jgi:hypothetical protein
MAEASELIGMCFFILFLKWDVSLSCLVSLAIRLRLGLRTDASVDE